MRETDHVQAGARAFAPILFRRVSTRTRKDPQTGANKELFLSLPQLQRNAIREKLLQCLSTETVQQVRNKIGDAVAEVARQYTEDGERPQVSWKLARWAVC